jgi:hypothetical protein
MNVLAVFFPSLMGFGILVSGALLVSDAVHKLLPHEGRRRRRRIAIGAYGVVAAAARTTGRRLPAPAFLRRSMRARGEYFGVALLALGGMWLVIVAGTEAYEDAKGVFHQSPWIYGLTIGFAIALGLVALLAAAYGLLHERAPAPMQWLVAHTVVGRLRIPSPDDAIANLRTERGAPI